jgi:hypothetical protein
VKRSNAIAQKQKNGSSNHGEPFLLKASPNLSWERSKRRKKRENKMKYKL